MTDAYPKYWDRPRETLAGSELREHQSEKLRAVIDDYYQAPVIRDLWNRAGVNPFDIDTIHDLKQAPVFRKDDEVRNYIAEGYTFGGRLTAPREELCKHGAMLATTSGTTGAPTNLMFTAADQEVAAEVTARTMWQARLRPGDTIASFAPIRDVVSKHVLAANKIGASIVRCSWSDVDRMIHIFDNMDPKVVQTFSRPLINQLNERFEEEGRDPSEVLDSVEAATFGGEPLPEEFATRVEEEWGIELFEIAGGLEPRWHGLECGNHDGFIHAPDDHFYFEAVDPKTDERVDEGERGELVMTTLSYEAMAHIRWGHEDIVELKRGKCDGCGRRGTRIKFFGRTGDMIKVADRAILPSDINPVLEPVDEMPNGYVQAYEDADEALRLRIGYDPSATDDVSALESRLERRLAEAFDVPVEVVKSMKEDDMREIGPSHKVPFLVK